MAASDFAIFPYRGTIVGVHLIAWQRRRSWSETFDGRPSDLRWVSSRSIGIVQFSPSISFPYGMHRSVYVITHEISGKKGFPRSCRRELPTAARRPRFPCRCSRVYHPIDPDLTWPGFGPELKVATGRVRTGRSSEFPSQVHHRTRNIRHIYLWTSDLSSPNWKTG